MTTYNLNLTNNFCDHWGLWEAVREILQNGEDQLTLNPENEITVDYNKSTKTLTVANKDSILNRSSLLFGGTTKSDDPNTIGKFGEGYKIALLIFQKLGIDVVIKNYAKNERWTTEMIPDAKYDGLEVLKVKIKKYMFRRLPDHNLSFEIKGISEKQWAEIQSKYLREQEVGEKFYDKYTKNEILFNPSLKGMVFINGLFVEKLSGDYAYGYNFHPSNLKLDRDRQTVAGFSFQFELKRLLTEYASHSEENAKQVMEIIKSDNKDLSSVESFTYPSNKLFDVAEESLKDYGDYAYPVSSQSEADLVIDRCASVKPVFVSKAEKTILSSNKKYESLSNFMKENENLNEKVKLMSPRQELESFFNDFKDDIYDYKMKEAFKKLIEKSDGWATIVDEDLEEHDVADLEEHKSETSVVKSHEYDINEPIEKESLESNNSKIAPTIFDDDIPF